MTPTLAEQIKALRERFARRGVSLDHFDSWCLLAANLALPLADEVERLERERDAAQADAAAARQVVEDALVSLDPAEETQWAKHARAYLSQPSPGARLLAVVAKANAMHVGDDGFVYGYDELRAALSALEDTGQ